MKPSLHRRHFLRSTGLALALPTLPSLLRTSAAAEAAIANVATNPLRLCYLYIPNGVNMEHWRPSGENESLKLNRSTASLEPYLQDLRFVSGLTHQHAFAGKDGGGDHARANASFLTGARAYKTAGADIHLGVSADQIVAKKYNNLTGYDRLNCLAMGFDSPADATLGMLARTSSISPGPTKRHLSLLSPIHV